MTELEKQLPSALEQLQQDYSQRLDEWERLRGMAEHVGDATGERGAERARVGLEHAGAEFASSCAACPTECIELRQRENEYQKTLSWSASRRKPTAGRHFKPSRQLTTRTKRGSYFSQIGS
jgi:hypothetical protein